MLPQRNPFIEGESMQIFNDNHSNESSWLITNDLKFKYSLKSKTKYNIFPVKGKLYG